MLRFQLLSLALLTSHFHEGVSDYPPAPGSGGAKCKLNADCGIPAANCRQVRDQCASLSGNCDNGVCKCATNYYGCSNCAAKSILVRSEKDPNQFVYSTQHPMLDGSGKSLNECDFPHGGKLCQTDFDCGVAGYCLGSHCVCPDAWLCDSCTMTLTDALYGLKCGMAQTGGGSCDSDEDCHNGSCLKTGGPAPYCQCNPLYTCDRCDRRLQDIVSGQERCPQLETVFIEEA
eukprot:m.334883 g.334883  ORF g.334883 m.334883 type:complete len:231 (-) comp17459_c0_seq1:43-735(-)